ncbi:MAG: glycoside hydrolase family 97 catalytic domain-containing protein [Bacteroidota bacterium]
MRYIFLLSLFIAGIAHGQDQPTVLRSPDDKLAVQFTRQKCIPQRGDAGQDPNCLFYSVKYQDTPIMLESQLGLVLGGQPTLLSNFEIVNVSRSVSQQSWHPIYGERSSIPDHYRTMVIHLRETIPPFRYLNLHFRAYNGGVAFRYEIPTQVGLQTVTIENEYTQFHLPENTHVWANYDRMQTVYSRQKVSEIGRNASRPMVFELPGGMFAALLEAHVDNYSRMMLDPFPRQKNTLISHLSGSVRSKAPFYTSWKLLLVAEKTGDLIEHNYLIYNLNPPSQLKDSTWIKPGKMIREMTLSTIGGKEYVDFAATHNLQYVLYDGGWYGDPIVDYSDAKEPDPWVNKIKDIPDHKGLDIKEVIEYGKQKGVGIFLYLDRRVLERRLDDLLPLFQQWGVKGLKFGFVNVGTQSWTQWLHTMVAKCAEYHLMVDVHDEYYPTGFSRTYPNLVTQEGILGNEAMPAADHNVNLAFTRMLAGAADYTPAYYQRQEFGNKGKYIRATAAHQLALPVVLYSPLQSLFWYDHPSDYQGEPEIEFWEQVPTTWDETKVLQASIGEFIITARRSGKEWFIGGITGTNSQEVTLDFSFLENERSYRAKLYYDDPKSSSRTKVGIKELSLDSSTQLEIELTDSGGLAMWIVPQ